MNNRTQELKNRQLAELDAILSAIDILSYRFRVAVVEQLSCIGLCDYTDDLIDRQRLKEFAQSLVDDRNILCSLVNFERFVTVVSLQFDAYKKYHESFELFLKERGLYSKNQICKSIDGWYYYTDSRGYLQKFVRWQLWIITVEAPVVLATGAYFIYSSWAYGSDSSGNRFWFQDYAVQ